MKYNANAVYSMRIDNVTFGDIIKTDNRAFAVCLTPDILQRGSIQRMLVIRMKPAGKTDILKRTKEDRETSIYIQLYGDRYVADITNIEAIRKENIDQRIGTLSKTGIGHLQSLLYHYFRMDDCEEIALARAKYDIQKALSIEEADVHNMIPCVVVSYDDEAAPETVEERVRIVTEALQGDKNLMDTLKALKDLPAIKIEKPVENAETQDLNQIKDSAVEPAKGESLSETIESTVETEVNSSVKGRIVRNKTTTVKPSDALKEIVKDVEPHEDSIEDYVEEEKPSKAIETSDDFEEDDVDIDKLEPSFAELKAIEEEEGKKRKKKKPVVMVDKPFVKPVRTSHNSNSNLMSLMNSAASTKSSAIEEELEDGKSEELTLPIKKANCASKLDVYVSPENGVYGRVKHLTDEVIITALRDRDRMSNKDWCAKYNVCMTNQYTKVRALEKEAVKRNLKIEE